MKVVAFCNKLRSRGSGSKLDEEGRVPTPPVVSNMKSGNVATDKVKRAIFKAIRNFPLLEHNQTMSGRSVTVHAVVQRLHSIHTPG